jgi:hypothetical protein
MANLYFLVLLICEMVPQLSGKPPWTVPDLCLPLCFVVGLSMLKDIYEDFFVRRRADTEENSRVSLVG